jgi:flagellar biosynthesis/type III secretory pathway protein FliH
MTENLAVIDYDRLGLLIKGRRIAAEDFLAWCGATETLAKANQLLVEARQESERLKIDAWQSGYQNGMDQAFKELALPILEAKTEARRIIDSDLSQVVRLAESMLQRILPCMAQEKAVRELLNRALAEIREERHISVKVHPNHLKLARDTIKTWSAEARQRCEVAVFPDATLEQFACVISSELGEIQVGFQQQLQLLTTAALQAAGRAEAARDIRS